MSLHPDVAARLDSVLDERALEAVWFGKTNSFAWLTDGGDSVIDRGVEVGIAAVGYDGEGLTVVTDNIEAPRLADEELPADMTIESYDWHANSLGEAVADVSATPAAADFDVPGFESVDTTPLRQPLTDAEINRFRSLGTEAAEVIETVMREAEPADTEREVAGRLRERLFARGIESPVVLVGGGERTQQYRHYKSKDTQLGTHALASIVAVRDGLCASASRLVAWDPPAWLHERTENAMTVEATALAATQAVGTAGGTAGEVFDAIRDAYAAVGYDGEWRNHHQGGAAGYASREWIATPDATDPVEVPMAYAWNPTVQGAKSEDTFLVSQDTVETLTATGDWPTTTVQAVDDDLKLDRHAVLEL